MRGRRVAPMILLLGLVPSARSAAQVRIEPEGFISSPRTRVSAADLARVVGVVADSRGTVYVLDQRRRQIVAFDRTGSFRYAAGRGGRGSEPFGVPTTMAIGRGASKDHLYVWDLSARRLSELLALPDSLRHLRDVRIDFSASDACRLGGRLFVFGLRNGKVVHEINANGTVANSFGDPVGPSYPGAQRRLSQGRIVCDEQHDQVLISPQQVPIVRAYSPRGVLRWSATLSRFLAVQVTPTPDGGLMYRDVGGSGSDVVISTLLAGDRVLVQSGRLTKASRSPDDFAQVATRVLRADDGREVAEIESLPWIVSLSGERAFAVAGADQPEIRGIRVRVAGSDR